MTRPSDLLERALADDRQALIEHPVYQSLESRQSLARLMQAHVYAVWDFMSLVKRLQRELTCVELPWLPPAHPRLARFVNEIVLDEESDRDLDGNPASHFDLYVQGMREVGVDTAPIEALVRWLGERRGAGFAGAELDAALPADLSPAVRKFVRETIDVALRGSTLEVAACFCYSREDVIPAMFRAFLASWPQGRSEAPTFVYYLERHIELDGDHHGDLARELVDTLAADASPEVLAAAERRVRRCIAARRELWDDVFAASPLRSLG